MILNLKKLDFSKLLLNLVFFLFFAFAITFFLFGNPNFWDSAGHISAAKTIHDYFWPDYTGWNFDYLMGFQQGLFYPPLFHYILATIMFFFEPQIAGKLLISFLIMLLPISIYYFSTKFYDDKKDARYLTIALTAGWFLIDKLADFSSGSPGGGVHGTFVVGLFPAFLTIHLMFFFLGSMLQTLKNNKNWKIPAVLLALSFLTHFTAYFLLIIIIILAIIFKEKRKIILKILIFGIGLSAFWWIPFFYYNALIPKAIFGAMFTNQLLIILIVVLALGFLQKDKFSKVIAIFCIVLISIWTISNIFQIPFQFYRIQPIIILLVIIPIFTFVKEKKHSIKFFLIMLFFIITIFNGFSSDIRVPSFATIEIFNDEKIDGQVLLLNDQYYLPYYHALYIDFVNKTNSFSTIGLFSESSLLSYLNCGLTIYFDNIHDCWGVVKSPQKRISENTLIKQFSSLNISHIISRNYPNRLNNSFESELYLKRNIYYYDNFWFIPTKLNSYSDNKYITKVWDTEFIEIPRNISSIDMKFSDWVNFSNEWFNNDDNKIYFLHKDIEFEYDFNAKITEYYIDKKNEEITVTIDAKNNIPILIKQNWSPSWKAYNENNQEIPIYLATPFSMVVIANNKITLKNENNLIELISRIISIITIILLIYYNKINKTIMRFFNEKNNKKQN